jgi:hypothetical protein
MAQIKVGYMHYREAESEYISGNCNGAKKTEDHQPILHHLFGDISGDAFCIKAD